jgi:protein SCO1/2
MRFVLTLVGCRPVQNFNGEVVDPPREVPLVGTNWNGDPFDLSSQKGKVSVVFFGYTFCPDICPFALADMKNLYRELGDRAEEVSIVFVSVDPHRDSVEKLSRYVPNFDPRFYGLRLEFGELEQVQEDFEVAVQYSQPKDGPGTDSFYYVDHT